MYPRPKTPVDFAHTRSKSLELKTIPGALEQNANNDADEESNVQTDPLLVSSSVNNLSSSDNMQTNILSSDSSLPTAKKTKLILFGFVFVSLFALVFVVMTASGQGVGKKLERGMRNNIPLLYSLTVPVSFDLISVADKDTFSYDSKTKKWYSRIIRGKLTAKPKANAEEKLPKGSDPAFSPIDYSIEWYTPGVAVPGQLVEGTRGMELSELKVWNGRLYTVDDRSGIVFELKNTQYHLQPKETPLAIPRFILVNGDGETSTKGMKCEWSTVKDGELYVGSIGKPWTTGTGEVVNYDPMFVKKIDEHGKVHHINWKKNFEKLQEVYGNPHPGYMVHEAVEWSAFHKKWFVLPRRISKESYDEVKDNERGANTLFIASEDFSDVKMVKVGDDSYPKTRGFSTMKFIPGRPNEIIALRTEEVGEQMKTYVTIFDITGKIILPDTHVFDDKLEGLEFA